VGHVQDKGYQPIIARIHLRLLVRQSAGHPPSCCTAPAPKCCNDFKLFFLNWIYHSWPLCVMLIFTSASCSAGRHNPRIDWCLYSSLYNRRIFYFFLGQVYTLCCSNNESHSTIQRKGSIDMRDQGVCFVFFVFNLSRSYCSPSAASALGTRCFVGTAAMSIISLNKLKI
jgi:hypothetical protein